MLAGESDHNLDVSTTSLIELAQAAFRDASIKVVQEADRHGAPVIVWEDNQIRYLTAAEAWERLKADAGQDVRPGRPGDERQSSSG